MNKYLRTNGSVGEQMIESILLENDINYKREYTFKNELGNNQRMDFLVYFEEIFYCIEYHGAQHYKETTWFGDSLETIQKRDKLKKEYCKQNNIFYVEIPYNLNNLRLVHEELNKVFPDIKKPKSFVVDKGVEIDTMELVEYYMEHTKEETAKKYGVEIYHIDNLLVNLEYDNKRKPKDIIQVYKRDEKIFEGTYNEIKEEFNFTMSNVLKCLNGELDKTSQHYFKYKDSEKDKVRHLKTKERHTKRGTIRGSSNKDVVLKDIYSGEETVYSSIKECHEITGLNKDKLYKLFNPNKSKQIIDKYIGKSYGGEYPITAEEALNIINP